VVVGVDNTGKVWQSFCTRPVMIYRDNGTKKVDAMLNKHKGLENGANMLAGVADA